MKSRLLILLFLLFTTIVHAQDNASDYQPITADNAAQLTQIARYGNGIFEQDAAWSPDGKTLTIAGSIGIWFYNTDHWDAAPQLIDLDKRVYHVAFSPDGKTLAYSSENNTTYLVDATTHQKIVSFDGGSVFAFSPDGKLFAVDWVEYPDDCGGGYCPPVSHVDVWKWANHEKITTIDTPMLDYGYPQEIVFSPDGKLLTISWSGIEFNTCGNTQSEVQVWHMDQLPQSSEDQTPQANISASQYIAISPKSDLIATEVNNYDGLNVGEIRLWDVQAGKERSTLLAGDSENWTTIGTMHFNADGTKLTALVGDYRDYHMVSWDTTTGERSTDSTFIAPINALIFSPDGKQMAGLTNNALRVWNVGESYTQRALVPLEESIVNAQIAPDGTAFAYMSAAQQFHLWSLDKRGGHEIGVSEPVHGNVPVLWSQSGSTAVYADNKRLVTWDIASGVYRLLDVLSEEKLFTLSADGSLLAYLGADRLVHVYDTVNRYDQMIFQTIFPRWVSMTFSPDGTQLLMVYPTGKMDGPLQVQLWNTERRYLMYDFGKFSQEQVSARFNRDGSQIAIQTFERVRHEHTRDTDPFYETRVFNVATGQPLFWDQNRYSSGEFNPDWTLFMLNKGDWSSSDIEVIDVATKKPAFEQSIHSFYGGGVGGFSPDGKRMTMSEISQNGCGGDDRGMGLWDMTTAKRIGKIGLPSGGMDFSMDSSLIVVGDRDEVTLWDARSGKYIGDLGTRSIPASYIIFNANSTRLITASSDGTLRVWGVPHVSS